MFIHDELMSLVDDSTSPYQIRLIPYTFLRGSWVRTKRLHQLRSRTPKTRPSSHLGGPMFSRRHPCRHRWGGGDMSSCLGTSSVASLRPTHVGHAKTKKSREQPSLYFDIWRSRPLAVSYFARRQYFKNEVKISQQANNAYILRWPTQGAADLAHLTSTCLQPAMLHHRTIVQGGLF
ncbi:uncharacterized protein LY79DRAFT_39268 [Colletotrichum navitas]|uniref:Uncharacterized protein n=1 Tax=Colletotrichum navitas TaxID=681940 RepID=A0AAD8UXT6_9PEZI|nr:uncharacterized protein LY79DRAFT_39268 [Colletotrichum navitas]KAK1572981.1 hypothetical protein LY79DRAFT_39268 [Colletotrichum navitas]